MFYFLFFMDVVLLCGQSNQAGRGGVRDVRTSCVRATACQLTCVAQRAWDGVVPDACASIPGVWCLRPDGDAWEQAQEPLHVGVDAPGKPCGVGPGLAFGAALLHAHGPAIGLVPCAVGGSALREWELPDGELGRRCLARSRAALAATCPAVGGPRLACLLFYQGETDAGDAGDAATWGARFERWVAAMRAELCTPELPVGVVAVTASTSPCPHLNVVRAAQLSCTSTVPRCFVVDAHGLALQADGLHLTADAQASLGLLLARAFLDFKC